MALIVVNLTDTFNDWRLKTNSQIAQVGDLAALTASNTSSIVGALNGMMEEVKDYAMKTNISGADNLEIMNNNNSL